METSTFDQFDKILEEAPIEALLGTEQPPAVTAPPAPVEELKPQAVFVNTESGEVVDLLNSFKSAYPTSPKEMSDDLLIEYIDELKSAKDGLDHAFKAYIASGLNEITRRLVERKAKSLPHPEIEIELEPVWSDYAVNLDMLREATKTLKPDEVSKVIVHVPELIPPPVPAHDEAGKAVSITALIKKYDGSQTAKLLLAGFHRVQTDTKLKFKRSRPKLPPGGNV